MSATPNPSFTSRVMDFCRQNPLRWINAVEFERVGGRQAWRTRVSNARQRFEAAGEGTIENRTRRCGPDQDGRTWTLSEYCYFPKGSAVAIEERAPEPRGFNANAPVEGRLI